MTSSMHHQPANDGSLGFTVGGRVEQPSHYTFQRLQAMDVVALEDLPLICGTGDPKGRIGPIKGVLLADIINETPVLILDHNDTKKMLLIISSADGYKTVFSWQELFNTEVGEGILIVMEKDGCQVHNGSGAVDLLSSNDFLSGPRYAKCVTGIEIVMVA